MEKKQPTFAQKVIAVQRDLKAPKSQFNAFGNYRYRSAEDILMTVKPLLAEQGLLLTISDDVVIKSESNKVRFYIKATATISDGEGHQISVDAWAREADTKTKMDDAQITGGASSYARKYALNGLFLIDDTKDPDATNTHGKDGQSAAQNQPTPANNPAPQVNDPFLVDNFIKEMDNAKDRKELTEVWRKYPELQKDPTISEAIKRIGAKFPKK